MGYVETVYLKGKACSRCPRTSGPDKGILRIELRQKATPTGTVPDWLVTELRSGEWTPKFPRSKEVLASIQKLVSQGVVDADLKAHPRTGELVVARVQAAHAGELNQLATIRKAVLQSAPHAAAWIARANLRDLQVAAKIVATPGYTDLAWPSRVWNAAFQEHSKQGDAARIASALGCKVQNRASSHGAWFYGKGTIKTPERRIVVDGELVVPEKWLQGTLALHDVDVLGIVENRDLASLAPGFTLALDGHCSPTQRHFVQEVARQGIPAWVWTDMDGAGITITRQVRSCHPKVKVVGLRPWPREWSLEQSAEQRNQALDAQKVKDDLSDAANHVLDVGWFEQERIFAEAELRGVGWKRLLEGDEWLV